MRSRIFVPLILLAAAAPRAHAQDGRAFVRLHEPPYAVCREVRREGGEGDVCVAGVAFAPSGVSRVLVNGAEARFLADSAGARRFVGLVRSDSAGARVEVAVHAAGGDPFTRRFQVRLEPRPEGGGFIYMVSGLDTPVLGQPVPDVPPPPVVVRTRVEAAPPEPAAAPPAKRWAVVVGITDYSDYSLRLQHAGSDALAFHEFLLSGRAGGGGFARENVRLLVNADATYRNIRTALFNFLRGAGPDDEVVVFFAGHGRPDPSPHSRNFYLLPYDAELANLPGSAFPMDDVQRAVRELRARDVLVITDACHSAGVALPPGGADRAAGSPAFEGPGGGLGSVAVFSASGMNESALEHPVLGHGIFTHFLLKGLSGAADADGDSVVTLGEAVAFTRDSVQAGTGNAQTPALAGTRYDVGRALSVLRPGLAGPAPGPRRDARADSAALAWEIEEWKKRVVDAPGSAVYRLELGRKLRRARRAAEAVAYLREAMQLDARSVEVRRELTGALREAGMPDDAVAELDAALRLYPRDPWLHAEYGAVLLPRGDAAGAAERFRRAAAQQPGVVRFQAGLGAASLRAGNAREAARAFERAAQLAPDSAAYRRGLAEALDALGDRAGAIGAMRAAVRIDGRDAATHFALGRLLAAAENVPEAELVMGEAISLAPGNAAYRHARAGLLLRMNEVEKALAELRQAAALDSANAAYQHDYGVALGNAGRPREAEAPLARAVALDSANAAYREALAVGLQAVGKPAEAMREFAAALLLAPNSASIHYRRGLLLRERGELADAWEAFNRAFTLDPRPEYRAQRDDLRRQGVRR